MNINFLRSGILILVSALLLTAGTQTPVPSQGEIKPPSAPADPQAELSRDKKILQDWADLARYREENAKVASAAPGEDRVVFMGDSITDGWGHEPAKFFPGKPFLNRGISGQTTPQMLVRFRPDVIALSPKIVLILAGTNDIAGNTGPETLQDIEGNLLSMAQLAQANGIRVVLCSVMPVSDYIKPQTARRPPAKILELNAWIKDLCERQTSSFTSIISRQWSTLPGC